ncbi:MAG: class I SAM-dependent methyltransferase [Anaerolineales bacterium]|nr:class I SAM-dependent methyltransferase [Chloroflexota bacterium]MBL6980712.1 class I SAM-dependent methyltransferase [Anaerolineales bacterium]
MILDLGCGTDKVTGAIGLENVPLPGVDVLHDLLDFPYPFGDGCASEVHLNHVIEHFVLADIQRILDETYRILQPGGITYISVPHVYSVAAWVDPTHKMAFTFGSAQFFDAHAAKAYYKEINSYWRLVNTSSRVTLFNWKRYRMRKLDTFLSNAISHWMNWLLKQPNPSNADLLVKMLPFYFVEIQWQLIKPS